ncbi:MAG: beta-xylosidase [Oligoflexia bacterium]|nr:beta-xylosidase [Oligoflexia bacterium]
MTIFYNGFHAPIGAHSSFTFGCKGKKGGLGLELWRPADQNVYIGLESKDGKCFEALPFFEPEEIPFEGMFGNPRDITCFKDKDISREYKLGTDKWKAGDIEFTVYSPVESIPDPESASDMDLKKILVPSVCVELVVDNSKCDRERIAFFGHDTSRDTDSMRIFDNMERPYQGIGIGNSTAIVTDSKNAFHAQQMSMKHILSAVHEENWTFALFLANTGSIVCKVPPKTKVEFRFAVCFFRPGMVTSGEATSYWYYRYFRDIESVARYTLENFEDIKARAVKSNSIIDDNKLNDAQKFQLCHAVRSYYGSTQLLDWDNRPFWVVNEGEYRMMNTLDLTIDHLFFEMSMNPWVVKNTLNIFASRYSYEDKLHLPGGTNSHPGGISFCHDMGSRNRISRPQYSTYEAYGLKGLFSHMTHEQLVNWTICATAYAIKNKDKAWEAEKLPLFRKCLKSLMNRDHPDDEKRTGIMKLDSSRTIDGSEITTYDSLDTSLGQARSNIYIVIKGWAAYSALEKIFSNYQEYREDAQMAEKQASRTADSVCTFMDTKEGYIHAIMGEDCNSQIIPAIEGLVFPHFMEMRELLDEKGKYGKMIQTLKTHFKTVFKKGVCIFPDGGWKLSSSAENSWLSKIYLNQFVARKILGFKNDDTGIKADQAHAGWLLKEENLYWAWSDQMFTGIAKESKYYPRGVTSFLWLNE